MPPDCLMKIKYKVLLVKEIWGDERQPTRECAYSNEFDTLAGALWAIETLAKDNKQLTFNPPGQEQWHIQLSAREMSPSMAS